MRVHRWITAFAAAALSILCLGWGEAGHKIVGKIAYERLTPTAKTEIDRLLALETTNLPEAAYWPDAVARRQAQYQFANQLHYANVPKGSAGYDPARDRPSGGDVVSAIEQYAAVLQDKTKPDADRLEALRFLAHFVGDIHQPLHVGYAEDRGGNDFWVKFFNRRMKLHAVWDTGLIEKSGFSWEQYAADLNGLIRPQDVTAYTEHMSPLEWAHESYRLAIDEAYGDLTHNQVIGAGYVDEKLPVVEDQLSIAGVRLAELINAMFPGADVGPGPTPTEVTVFVTPSGAKYHAAGCRFLQGAHSPMTLEAAKNAGKEPCRVCDPPR